MSKPVVFITISRAIIAKNLLLNDFIKLLREKYRVIFFVPKENKAIFEEVFEDYEVEVFVDVVLSGKMEKVRSFLIAFAKSLIYNPTIELRTRYGLMCRSDDVKYKKVRYILQKYLFGFFLSRFKFLRDLIRFIDKALFPCDEYSSVIAKYKPVLVFVTNITIDNEIQLLRNCKNKKIKSIAMAKSWDNASKFGFREKTDKFIVWSEYMQEELLKFQNYKKEDTVIVGIPQFDHYFNPDIQDDLTFKKKYGLSEDKKTIFFGSEGPVCESDPYIVEFLRDKIKEGELKDYQLLIRPHYSYMDDEKRFEQLVDNSIVFLDNDYSRSEFKDNTELSLGNVKNLISSIKYSDVCITSASTLVLDIVANGKYPILYNFDKDKNTPYKNSVRRLYSSLWMKEIVGIGLENLAGDEDDLIKKINMIEGTSKDRKSELDNLVSRFCYKIDGKSSRRLFEFIDNGI
jgi:hypothetical protein